MGNDFGGNSVTPDYEVSKDDKMWGLLAHLSPLVGGLICLPPLGPFIVWQMYKDKSKFVTANAKQALYFSGALFAIIVVAVVLMLVLSCIPVVGWILSIVLSLACSALGLANIFYMVISAIRANEGKIFEYPFTSKFVK
jgi:uncharacterized Tic20 family protein